ncbi:rna polymerase i-specific transcription initiation factor rrn6-like protein, partial [Lasius niger]
MLGSGATGDATHQRPSYVNPNPLLTLQHHQTGGNAHSDVSFNPAVLDRPPQLVVLDECGYWSVWSILGAWQVPKKTLRLSQYKCGHISEGFLEAIPPSPSRPAERHGMLFVGRSETDETYHASAQRAGALETNTSPSQYMLLWNSERFEILDLASDTFL